MTLSTIGSHAPPSRRPPARPIAFLAALAFRLAGRIVLARARAQTRAVLAGLDDATLKDLGIHRSEIASIASIASARALERRRPFGT